MLVVVVIDNKIGWFQKNYRKAMTQVPECSMVFHPVHVAMAFPERND